MNIQKNWNEKSGLRTFLHVYYKRTPNQPSKLQHKLDVYAEKIINTD